MLKVDFIDTDILPKFYWNQILLIEFSLSNFFYQNWFLLPI